MKPEPVTPAAVFDLFKLISEEDQRTFLRLLGGFVSAEVLYFMLNCLPLPEQRRFTDMVSDLIGYFVFSMYRQEARRLAREQPGLPDDEFDRELQRRVGEWSDHLQKHSAELERARLKEQRDRKSDPETINRNVEICDLRRQDRKKWSLVKLTKKYGFKDKKSVTNIVKEESKWRRLAAQSGGGGTSSPTP